MMKDSAQRFNLQDASARIIDAGTGKPRSAHDAGFWATLFHDMFVHGHDELRDDLLFYVRLQEQDVATVVRHTDGITKAKDINSNVDDAPYFVLRKTNPKLPKLDDGTLDWYATFYLNLLIQQFRYKLTVAVLKNKRNKLALVNKVTVEAFATPSKRSMEKKGTVTECTYPYLFFAIDDYEDAFKDTELTTGDMVCVEVTAHAVCGTSVPATSIFSGSVNYAALHRAHSSRTKSSWESLGSSKQKRSYLSMRGPAGRGEAQVAVGSMDGTEPSSLSNMLTGALNKLRFSRTQESKTPPPDLSVLLTWVCVRWTDLIEDVVGLRSTKPLFLNSRPTRTDTPGPAA